MKSAIKKGGICQIGVHRRAMSRHEMGPYVSGYFKSVWLTGFRNLNGVLYVMNTGQSVGELTCFGQKISSHRCKPVRCARKGVGPFQKIQGQLDKITSQSCWGSMEEVLGSKPHANTSPPKFRLICTQASFRFSSYLKDLYSSVVRNFQSGLVLVGMC